MIRIMFFIRFRGQLRRTKPELISSLENTVSSAVQVAGGVVDSERRILSASFDEDRIGFCLDIIVFLEKVQLALENTASGLCGYALALVPDNPDIPAEKLCRFLSSAKRKKFTGIWCSGEIRKALEPYMEFDLQAENNNDNIAGACFEFRAWRPPEEGKREYPYREKIKKLLVMGGHKNTALLGPEFIGKRDSIRHYCAGLLGDVPPLVVRFGTGSRGLICFADAFTQEIRSFISDAVPGQTLEELDKTEGRFFRERLADEWSPYLIKQIRGFIKSLLLSYIAAAKKYAPFAVLVLENISQAHATAAEIFKEVYFSLDKKEELLVFASGGSTDEIFIIWGGVFHRVLKFSSEDFTSNKAVDLPFDLWELSYIVYLMGRYFPARLFPQLFEEDGLSRDMYFRGLAMLVSLGVLTPENPVPEIADFASRAETALGKRRKEKIRYAVRERLLMWAGSGKLRPCFNLLKILLELGERAGDDLVLRSLKADVLNGTHMAIDEALNEGSFASTVGDENAPVLRYVYKTLNALVLGNRGEIEKAFREPVPSLFFEDGRPCYAAFRAQVQINLAAFCIGSRSIDAASEAVREAMVLSRDPGKNSGSAYRLFSLVNLSRQRLDDALEYISFALEQAGKAEQHEELIVACCYASSINFLYGNISKAERLANKAEKTAIDKGQPAWADKAKFLKGRLRFELGLYEDALEIFESLYVSLNAGAGLSGNDERSLRAAGTVRAWIYRTNVFLGRFLETMGEDVSAVPDMEIFRIEAAYLASDYAKAESLAETYIAAHNEKPEDIFLFTEQPDWSSGFAQCEYMFQPEKASGARMVQVYSAMARCALRPLGEAKSGILGSMQRFIRDELLPDTDPNDSFFFYAWYSMLKDAGIAQVDIRTVASVAFKRLQRRAARIDDVELRQAYLLKSRWNSALNIAARENGLAR